MHRIASLLVGGAVLAGHACDAGAAPCPPLVLWQAERAGEPAASTRAQLQREAQRRGCRWIEAPPVATAEPPSLAAGLAAVLADYRAFKFAPAVQALDRLAATAQATGGGDLDARRLAELYLYRGLSKSELGQHDAAWDDFVRAARLDPARVLDEAQFPPRAVAAYRRAAVDAAALPHASVRIVAPTGARVQLDGRDAAGTLEVALGTHFIRVRADGYVPFGGAVDVTATDEQLTPALIAVRAPPAETLLSLAGGAPALIAVLERAGGEWRLALRAVAADGTARVLERAVAVDGADSAAIVVTALVHQLLDAPAPPPSLIAPPPNAGNAVTTGGSARRRRLPAWGWALIGVAAAAAIVVPIAAVYGPPTPQGTIGGSIGPLK